MVLRSLERTAAEANDQRPSIAASSGIHPALLSSTLIIGAVVASVLQGDGREEGQSAIFTMTAAESPGKTHWELEGTEEGKTLLQRPLHLTRAASEGGVRLGFALERDGKGEVVVDVGASIFRNTQSIRGMGSVAGLIENVSLVENGNTVRFSGGAGHLDVPLECVRQSIAAMMSADTLEEPEVRLSIHGSFTPGKSSLLGKALSLLQQDRQPFECVAVFRREPKQPVQIATHDR